MDSSVALVTGVTSGVGRGIATAFAQLGARVIGVGRRRALGEELERELASTRGEFRFVVADVRRSADCDAAVAEAVSGFGRLDVLVNNAGVEGPVAKFHMLTDDEWDDVLDTNVKGTIYAARAALRPMLDQQHGVIINIASTAGAPGCAMAHLAPYCTSKAAVIQLSNTMALEYQEYGVRVNSIILGRTKGDTHVGTLRKYAEYLDLPNPSGAVRLYDEAPKLDPVAVGRFLALLALDDAAILTGATIALDHGTSAGGALSDLMDVVVRQYCEPVSDVGTTTSLTP